MQYTTDVAARYARHRGPVQAVVQALITGAGLTGASRVLEVGCGTGNFCSAISEQAGCRCEGCDPSDGMLAQARIRAPRLVFLPGRAEALPYPEASFDLVFSVDVIHHVTGHADYMQEAFRVLRPGGRLCTVTESHDAIRLRSILSVYFPETVERQVAIYPCLDALSGWMTPAGFTQIDMTALHLPYQVTDISAYREKSYSCLHGILEEAYQRGMARLEADFFAAGPNGLPGIQRTALLWGMKPQGG